MRLPVAGGAMGEVHLWTCAPDDIADAAWPALEAVLDAGERDRARRFHRDRDRRAYIAAHALLRHLLGWIAGGPPGEWRFEVGEFGKPELDPPSVGLGLRFNLAHAHRLVAATATFVGVVGVDIEPSGADSSERGRADLAIADRFFAAEEAAALRALPDEGARGERFIRLWTLKEAFVKATGRGLSHGLADFAFVSLDPARVVFNDPVLGDPEHWTFWQRQVDGHALAVAVHRPIRGPLRIFHRSVSPPFPSWSRPTGG